MTWFGNLYRSTLGKKAVMALTGVILWAFVLGHMIGNLKLFGGAEGFNQYAEWLRLVGYPLVPHSAGLWIVRIVLLVAVGLHIHAAYVLTVRNRQARPAGYERVRFQAGGWAARTMRWSGVALLLFIVYHILHFTTGQAHHDFVPGDVYHNVLSAFGIWWVTLLYVVAMVMLGLHLWHGLWSFFQSLGWNHPRFNSWRGVFAVVFSLLITLGFLVVPVMVFAGLVTPGGATP
ncbi:MAG TPA: succinate dehydrogenase cytochrome b subunit [Thermoanaerobaculia bacterium]|nr:succinate dehydrogenase cytochrome b subunit [Thermoanaerobaculia bacterium]